MIHRVTDTKLLGFYIDSQLLWSVHLNKLSTKLARSVRILGNLRYYTSLDILISVFYSFIYSRPFTIRYYSMGYSRCSSLKPSQNMTKKALRAIKFKKNRYSSVSLARE